MIIPGKLTDSSVGTASLTAMTALADGSTYANDVAALRNALSTTAVIVNKLIDCVTFLAKRVNDLEAE